MDRPHIDVLLLLALPASGKSEVRRYLKHVDRELRIDRFHVAATAQLDDYPYVEFMRDADEVLTEEGATGRFFQGSDGRFVRPEDWGTLLQLVNDDFAVITDPAVSTPAADPEALFRRIDEARVRVGAPVVFSPMDPALRTRVAARLEQKTRWVVDELFSARPDSMDGRTLVIEFARGGPSGADMPLGKPHGYGWNLAQLRPEILERACVLYIWVTPEESRRKNAARAVPGETNTVLFHAAPEEVMVHDYGSCDMHWLIEHSDKPDTIGIEAHGKRYQLPVGVFDNREDLTTFARGEPSEWEPATKDALDGALADAMAQLWRAHQAR